ncbi:hypothetical protein SCHPADRAFT_998708 [Schizopora paradoxa]|uniref:Uncharacterized protein n=1 Tax=Schizopora paradoxa TaxID=27342 RepID=A0A0H2RJ30_9AGAM|nr:hypothetical protein SCHPADRAFT_998708 [Schizopora paradoxa]
MHTPLNLAKLLALLFCTGIVLSMPSEPRKRTAAPFKEDKLSPYNNVNREVSVRAELSKRLNTGLIKDFSIPEERDVKEDKLSPYNERDAVYYGA